MFRAYRIRFCKAVVPPSTPAALATTTTTDPAAAPSAASQIPAPGHSVLLKPPAPNAKTPARPTMTLNSDVTATAEDYTTANPDERVFFKPLSPYTMFLKEYKDHTDIKGLCGAARSVRCAELYRSLPNTEYARLAKLAKAHPPIRCIIKPKSVIKLPGGMWSLFTKKMMNDSRILALPAEKRFKTIAKLYKTLSQKDKSALEAAWVRLQTHKVKRSARSELEYQRRKEKTLKKSNCTLTPAQLRKLQKKAEKKKASMKAKRATKSNKPKKALSGYFAFCKANRHNYKHVSMVEGTKQMAAVWRGMSAEEKKAYDAVPVTAAPAAEQQQQGLENTSTEAQQ